MPPRRRPPGDNRYPAGFLTRLGKDRHLSGKQQMVLRRLLGGESHKDIARALGISLNTVNSHLKRIYEKFGVHDQSHLILGVGDTFRRLSPKGYRQS